MHDFDRTAAFRANVDKMILLERFRNDGSPTGLTWSNSSSAATCPRKAPAVFALPLLEIPQSDCDVLGEIPLLFRNDDNLRVPIHPDVVHLLSRSHHASLATTRLQPLLVAPTASPRTVLVNEASWIGFVKLDYPLVLGRFSRELWGVKLRQGLGVSELLLQRRAYEFGLYHLPETGVIEYSADSGRRAGVLFREPLAIGASYEMLIPFFALFSEDYLTPDDRTPLVVTLANRYGGPDWILRHVVLPLVASFWGFVGEFGLWPEPHAQNVLLGLTADGSTCIVWRDCQGFRFDRHLTSSDPPVLGMKSIEGPDAAEQRSLIYDWTLGRYLLDPLISAVETSFLGERERLIRQIVEATRRNLGRMGKPLLPEGHSYSMSLAPPQGRRLLATEQVGVKYR
ncbi:MAG: hypothetical protein HY854_05925 [Burkholderiales bacterium]|nr:hypothetical protein [Burkholderiales bacterium]